MAVISRIQFAANATTASTLVVTLPGSPTTGNTLVMLVEVDDLNGVASITQTGVTWVQIATHQNTTVNMTSEIWVAQNISPLSLSATINPVAIPSGISAILVEYTGLRTSGTILDKNAAANSGVSQTATIGTGPTSTTNRANELWIAHGSAFTSTTTVSSVTNGFTHFSSTPLVGGTSKVFGADLIASSKAAADTQFNLSNPTFWVGMIATLFGDEVDVNTSDNIVVTEDTEPATEINVSDTASVAVTDAIETEMYFDRAVSSSIVVTDQLAAGFYLEVELSDTVSVVDSLLVEKPLLIDISVYDVIALSDDIVGSSTWPTAFDQIVVNDSVLAEIETFQPGFANNIAVVDAVLAVIADIKRTSDLDINVSPQRNFLFPMDINIGDALGTRAVYAGLNAGVQGEEVVDTDLDVHVQGTIEKTVDLDMGIRMELPNRYMRMRGDVMTRYFGGNPSDGNFFEGFDPPTPGATVQDDIGVFNYSHRKLIHSAPNDIPTPLLFDKWTLPLVVGASSINTIGWRAMTAFRLVTFGPNSSIGFGLNTVGGAPLDDWVSGTADTWGALIVAEKDMFQLRLRSGTTEKLLHLGTVDNFIGRYLILEQELIGTSPYVTEFRLFDRDLNLDRPLVVDRVSDASPANVGDFFIESIGRHTPELPTSQPNHVVEFEYIDVEPGTGSVYTPNAGTGVTLAEAKVRPIQDRPPFLLRAEGTNTVYVALTPDGLSFAIEENDSIIVDTADPIITVVSLIPDSPVVIPGSPDIVKGSLQPGFSSIRLVWNATHSGTYSLRVNSTGMVDGIEIETGTYTEPNNLSIEWDFADFPQIDAVYDITLYLVADTGKATAKKLGIYILP